MYIIKYIAVLGLILLAIVSTEEKVQAETSLQRYSVTPILPDNQDKDTTNYYSITTPKGTLKQKLNFIITNETPEPLTIEMYPLNSLSSSSGELQYIRQSKTDSSVIIDERYSFDKHVKVPDSVTIPANGKITSSLEIDVAGVTGNILGAIGFKVQDKSKEDTEGQFKLISEHQMVLGVKLSLGDIPEPVYSVSKVSVHLLGNKYVINLPFAIEVPTYISKARLEYIVLNNKREVIFTSTKPKVVSFAPVTKSKLFLNWETSTVEEGATYYIQGKLYYDFNGQSKVYEFEKDFKYTDKQEIITASDETITSILVKSNLWKVLGGVILLLSIMCLILAVLRKKRKQSTETKKDTSNN